jgi:hypothetical protein
MVQPEKRSSQRFHTALPVFLENAEGLTRDMSTSGVYFWKDGRCRLGELISFSIELYTPEGRMMWKCKGDVVRTEALGNDVGVAVRITESAKEPINT